MFYNAVCWVIVLAAYYPATHTVCAMVEDDNFAQTWYVFWVLPLAFILLNLFMIPRYQSTLQTGRVLQGYIVLSSALLVFMFCFNAVFLLMASSLNRNAKLQQENQFLSMQQQRYENPQDRHHRGSAAGTARHAPPIQSNFCAGRGR